MKFVNLRNCLVDTMPKKNTKKIVVYSLLAVLIFFFGKYSCKFFDSNNGNGYTILSKDSFNYIMKQNKGKLFTYDRSMPLVFVGGMPRSGTTLMRAMLDAHQDVRCGEETRIIPRILSLKGQWTKTQRERDRLREGGVTDEVIYSGIAAFIMEVIAKHGEPAPVLCNKDPFTLKYMIDLSKMFPNGKYLLMIRDGRAVVHSVMSRKVTITGFDLGNFEKSLGKWNQVMSNMYNQCIKVGPSLCMMVFYEQLVLHPREMMTRILNFLSIPWDEKVMHHEQYVNKPGGISLSKTERSTDQVVKPVNLEALTKWAPFVPEDVRRNIRSIAPMLEKLGYDVDSYPPKYGVPDPVVWNQTNEMKKNSDYWVKKVDQIQWKKGKSDSESTTPLPFQ